MIIGNSTVNTTLNSTSIQIGTLGTTNGALLTNTSITIGNSTVNTTANSTHFFSGNSTVYGYSNSTQEGFVNSTANSGATPASQYVQNSTVNSTLNIGSLFLGNSTVNSTVNSITYSYAYTGASVTRPYCSVLQAVHALVSNSNSTVQAVFPAGQATVTLAATTTYLIDAVYIVTNATGTSVTTSVPQTSFGNSTALGSIYYGSTTTIVNSNTTGGIASTNAATQAGIALPASANIVITIKGAIATGAAASTITPQLSFSVACNSTPQVNIGSYIAFTPITGNTTAGTSNLYGLWT
jgi:hypothetical protein